jgi:hypothetical protein
VGPRGIAAAVVFFAVAAASRAASVASGGDPLEPSSAELPSANSLPGPISNDWVDGPAAPASPASTLPPAVAPREETTPDGPLVLPPVPPEGARVVIDDGLLARGEPARASRELQRTEVARTADLDVDTALARWALPGLWWLSDDAGQARLSLRGMPAEDVAFILDDVPLVDGGGLVAPTSMVSLLAPARWTVLGGPRIDIAGAPAASGAVVIDDGGALVDVGESARTDGWLGGGVGGADGEKGLLTLLRTGWRTVRVTAHATLLQRDDLRTGRMLPSLPPVVDPHAGVLPFSGGGGGTVGARVDGVPFAASRLFATWIAGRTLDTFTPADAGVGRPGCAVVDDAARPLDCLRIRERGADIGIVGFDVRRALPGAILQPSVRLHVQRAIVDVERSGVDLRAVERARDEQQRLGARIALAAVLPPLRLVQGWVPRVETAVDSAVDTLHSRFDRRSTRGRDAEPPGDGLSEPARARFVDEARATTTTLGLVMRADPAGPDDRFAAWGSARLALSSVRAPVTEGRLDASAVAARAALQAAPSFDVGARLRVWESSSTSGSTSTPTAATATRATLALWTVVGRVGQLETTAAQLRGPEPGLDPDREAGVVVVDPAPPGVRALPFLEAGAVFTSPVADVDVTAFVLSGRGALSSVAVAGHRAWRRGEDVLRRGVEAAATLRAADGALTMRLALAGVTADAFAEDQGGLWSALLGRERPSAGTVQPQSALSLRWTPPSVPSALRVPSAPSSSPFSFFGGVRGALPQTRLSAAEQRDRSLCPELPTTPGAEQVRPCSGAPGFALLDVGAAIAVGSVRIDVTGENVFDTQGTWRGALLGSGGQAVRARVVFLF